MDAAFVPALTFGPKAIADLRPHTHLRFDAHLMTRNPERIAEDVAAAGADAISFHAEACVHSHRLLQRIKELGKDAGIAINPGSPVSSIEALLPFVDHVLVMTVNPGFGGQKMIPECLEKARILASIRADKGYRFVIQADGGIAIDTVKATFRAGVDFMVVGSAFYGAPSPLDALEGLRSACADSKLA
jgi:ribulose-phosphate 3-epimerase